MDIKHNNQALPQTHNHMTEKLFLIPSYVLSEAGCSLDVLSLILRKARQFADSCFQKQVRTKSV